MAQEVKMRFRDFLERLEQLKDQAPVFLDNSIRIGKGGLCPIAGVYAQEEGLGFSEVHNDMAHEYGEHLGLHPWVVDQIIESADWPSPGIMRGLILQALGLSEGVDP